MKKRFKEQVRSILVIFFIAGGIQSLIFCGNCGWELMLWYLLYGGTLWVVIWKANELCVDLSGRFATWLEQPVRRFLIAAVLIIILSSLGYFSVDAFFNILLWGQSPNDFVNEITFEEVYIPVLISFVVNMFMHGYFFLKNWRQEAVRLEKLRNEHLSMQFESLKNQLNPHFLFNSLNALSSLVYDDQSKAVSFIRKLSDVYRYVLEHREKEIVPLQDELAFAKSYLFLQKIRFSENISARIPEDAPEDRHLPPMALQLLLENAVKHNVVSKEFPLMISVEVQKDNLIVKNTIREKKVKDSTGIGLNNLKERYRFLTDKEVEVRIEQGLFRVQLPLLTFAESTPREASTTSEKIYEFN